MKFPKRFYPKKSSFSINENVVLRSSNIFMLDLFYVQCIIYCRQEHEISQIFGENFQGVNEVLKDFHENYGFCFYSKFVIINFYCIIF